MAAGEDVAAIIDLVEQAALRSIPLPQHLADAVGKFADDPSLAPDDIAAIREDLATIASISTMSRVLPSPATTVMTAMVAHDLP
ncbi:MAG: hypothetical protein WBH51_21485 [Mycolicibacter algericus]|uniref:hypothetical protein n=1 Tax=Mycolicibacter algericus TaxID=1288388 RepID=UPI003C70C866